MSSETIGWILIIALGVAVFGLAWALNMWMSAVGKALKIMTSCIEDLDEKNRKERLK